MQLMFDTCDKRFVNPNSLGLLLMMFTDFYRGGLYHHGSGNGWTQSFEADRKYLVAVMGDEIYDELENTKFKHYHHDNGLHVIWYCDGSDTILFYKEGDDGFAIINDTNGAPNCWEVATFDDPRNDSDFYPF